MFQFIIKRKVLIGLTAVLIILLGGYAISKLDKELMPPVKFDGAFVSVVAGDMPAAEVERRITTPLEQSILAIDGVENTYSTTSIGQSMIQVMIADGRGEEVTKEVESVTSSITSQVDEITDVRAFQASMGSSYEFFMDISNGDMDEMSAFAKEVLEPRLEELPEVRDVDLMGIQEYEMVVSFDREKMLEQALHISDVIPIIEHANGDATLGEFSNEESQPLLRWETDLSSVEDVENISIPTANGFISLGDIAEVTLQPLENSSYVWKNGTKDFIFVQVGRTSDVTQIELAEAIRTEVQNIKDEGLVNNFEINELVAQADYVKESIGGVTDNILVGGILAIVILLLFLRNIRATLIIGISIPTSILLTFLTMWLLDYSFNMLSLIALGLGIGMMVDASIVILESIYKKKEQGYIGIEAVLIGTKEVASAVIASVLTTIMVFYLSD